ncbi:MAG: hypothetical protein J5494_08935, partial [Candidatus Methanomethylophilaceae archaeon]|nr:hypothetical protein [Candidatus Methanomethylophilaceae archaeon]
SSGQQKFEVDGSLYFDGRVKADLEAAISDLDPYSGLGKILTDLGIDLSYIDDRVTETGSAVADIAVDMDIVTDLASLNNFSMSSAWHIIAADSEARSSSYAKGYVYTGIKEIEEGKIISETGIKQGIDSRFAEIMNADLTFSGIGIQFLPDTPGQSSWSNRTGVSGTVEGSIGYLLPLMADMTRYVPQGPFRYDISDEINYHGKSVPQSGYYDVSFGIDFPSIDLPVITGDDFAELLENFIPGLYLGRILQILKTFDPTMDYNKFFNILLSMFPNVDVRFPIDFGEILMDKIPDLQYRYPFEKTDIPSFLFAGDSFKIPPQEADKIRGRVLAENDKLESLLYHVPYPVTFRDGDKVISEVMAGYGTEPAFPEYTSPSGEAAGWKFEDGTPWVRGVNVVKGETVLYPAYSKTVTDKPSAGDLDDADIIIWKKGSSAEELDLGFLDGTYGKVLIVDVNNGSYTWELPAVGGPYSGKTLKTLISPSDRESEISGKYESVTLGFEQAGTRVDGLLVSYNVGN